MLNSACASCRFVPARASFLLSAILATTAIATGFPGTGAASAQDCDLVDQYGNCVDECDFGEYELDGECRPECPEGYEPDDVLGTCELDDSDTGQQITATTGKVTIDAIAGVREGQTFLISGKVQDKSGQGIPGAQYRIVIGTKGHDVMSKSGTTLAGGEFSQEFKAPDVNGKQEYLVYVSTPYGLGSRIFDVNESGCLIATAAFGSELAPQVQFLREFRDQRILSTAAGSSFMSALNTVYYSFSPYVADYEREQPWLQAAVRAGIQPLLGILAVSEKAYSIVPGELGSIAAGLVASSLIGAVYASPVALAAARRLQRRGPALAVSLSVTVAILVASVLASALLNNDAAMTVTTSALVVATLALSTLAVASSVSRLVRKRDKNGDGALKLPLGP